MKYKLLNTAIDEITVILEDGGVACIRGVEELDEGDGRQSTTDYYAVNLTDKFADMENVWDELGEGKMYYNDWITPYDDPAHIQEALRWLCVGEENFTIDDTIWANINV